MIRISFLIIILIAGSGAFGASSISMDSTYQLRIEKKMGVGARIGGTSGLLGAIVEINLDDLNSVLINVGRGQSYNTVGFFWKPVYDQGALSYYSKVGYSRWYNSSGSFKGNDSAILDQILTAEQLGRGQFTTDFFVAGFGVQYSQLHGDYQGFSYFMELEAILDLRSHLVLPTGSIGSIYYF